MPDARSAPSLHESLRHCEERSDEAIQNCFRGGILDCFASLAMTE